AMPKQWASSSCILFFFFQAEDGIRDGHVTGVQTCALPISKAASNFSSQSSVFILRSCVRLALVTSVACTPPRAPPVRFQRRNVSTFPKSSSPAAAFARPPGTFSSSQRSFSPLKSEERRVGKECRSGGVSDDC